MTIRLVSNEKIAETSSKGNQEKWLEHGRWYKLDQFGYGYDGLLGRWSVYAVTGGHGNNKGMIEHFNAQKHSCHDLQFSVLQVLSKAMSKEQIIDAETLWKKKLLTYEPFGMNKS